MFEAAVIYECLPFVLHSEKGKINTSGIKEGK